MPIIRSRLGAKPSTVTPLAITMVKHSRRTLARISVTRPCLVLLLILLTFSTHCQICEASGLRSLREQQPQPKQQQQGADQDYGMAESQATAKKRFRIHPDDAEKYRQAVAAMARPMPGAADTLASDKTTSSSPEQLVEQVGQLERTTTSTMTESGSSSSNSLVVEPQYTQDSRTSDEEISSVHTLSYLQVGWAQPGASTLQLAVSPWGAENHSVTAPKPFVLAALNVCPSCKGEPVMGSASMGMPRPTWKWIASMLVRSKTTPER
jgi:hypothetical protein